ncbi:MAG: hypothetical protein H6799_01705 [Candidatus Nomurabacteria bacterium]|nr:MAG: hypothetical protein H6799_01705 [Candidatus Nomurabacteria bacterium]HRV75791.1 hypothetical protein [Candidatus Saccharimonadales bacterium]
MEEDKDFLSAEELYEAGAGFVVGGHNYGRLDRLTEDDIRILGRHVERLDAEAERLKRGLEIARVEQLEKDREEIRERYGH